jgi:GT2 family glycosyltransferase
VTGVADRGVAPPVRDGRRAPDGFGVAAVIVNHNAGSLLAECVASAAPQCDQVVVVDNASDDGSPDRLGDGPLLLRSRRNVGFASACNLGWRATRAPAVLFLNPDAVLAPGAVERLAKALLAHPDAGVVGPRLTRPDGAVEWGAARRIPSAGEALRRLLLGRRPAPAWRGGDRPFEVDAVSGACMLVSRPALEAVGGWDEGYFLHYEDLDLCVRLKTAGYRAWVEPRAECVHAKGACSKARPVFVAFHKHRGMARFVRRHWVAGWRWLAWPVLWTGVWGHFLGEGLRRGFSAVLRRKGSE